jgi:rod shape-determining protein MreC
VRVAALGSPVRRTVAPSYSSRATGPLKRRLVVGLLVLASLVMITVYFRESPSGTLHDFQSVAASAMRPFEVGAHRIARPFRDAYGWVAGVFHAKSENERLREELDRLRQQMVLNATAVQEYEQLARLLRYQRGSRFPQDFPREKAVTASVLSNPAGEFEQKIVIAAGSSSGIRVHDAVVTAQGLVGQVTKVLSDTAQVTLLTDEESAVTARDVNTGAIGVLRHGAGDTLILDRVPKNKVITRGDLVITAGRLQGKLPSLFPAGIQVGWVTSAQPTDIDLYQNAQVMPFVDFTSLDTVLVLVSEKQRPRIP